MASGSLPSSFALIKDGITLSEFPKLPEVPQVNRNLEWVSNGKSERRYELRADRKVCGLLAFSRGHSSLAVARTSAGAWTFKRVGFFSTAVTVRSVKSDSFLALFNPRGTKTHGVLSLSKGPGFLWSDHFWSESTPRSSTGGKPIVIFREGAHPDKAPNSRLSAGVLVEPQTKGFRELPLLLTLGWYLILLQHQDRDIIRTLSPEHRIAE